MLLCVVYPIVVVKAIDIIMGRGGPSKPPPPTSPTDHCDEVYFIFIQLGPEERVVYSTPENEDHIFTETKTRTNEDVSQALPDTIDVSRGQHDYSQHFTLVVMYQSIILCTIY